MMKLYKNNIYINRFSVFVYIFIFTLCIFIGSFIDIQEYGINISELQLSYNNLNLYKQWLYILICMLIILKIISFTEDYLYALRVGTKDKLWSLIIQNVLITNFIIYICNNIDYTHRFAFVKLPDAKISKHLNKKDLLFDFNLILLLN